DFTPRLGTADTKITLRGTGFNLRADYNMVHLAASMIRVTEVNSDGTELKFLVPDSWTGAAPSPLTINFDEDVSVGPKATSAFPFAPTPPTITDFIPKTGPTDTEITLRGTGFVLNASYNYIHLGTGGQVRAHEVNLTGTELKFRVPAYWSSIAAGALILNFSSPAPDTPGATSTASFTPVPAEEGASSLLALTDFSPKTGAPCTEVTIKGTGFHLKPYKNFIHLSDAGYIVAHEVNAIGTELKFRVPDSWEKASAGKLTLSFSDDPITDPIKVSTSADFTPTAIKETDCEKDKDTPGTGSRNFAPNPILSIRLEQSISVRPNPASQYIEIDTPAPTHLKIIDPTGKVLRAEQIARGLHRISIQDLSAGSYLLLLQIGSEGTSYTFIKS
ncbi:MAG: IPT/TIG domain-containing protein, partial [Cytophagales bacterium]|nr:IPT/TIG domain-containing protein [Cytophagales bacterium]